MACAEFSKFACILNAALSQHCLSGFGIAQLDGTAEEALRQIEEKGYAREYAADSRKVYKIGASFSSETGTINDWAVD